MRKYLAEFMGSFILTAGTWVSGIRRKLIDSEILVEEAGLYVFKQDFIFGSPSTAAAAVLGRRANGWTEWKNNNGKTIDEIYRLEISEKTQEPD